MKNRKNKNIVTTLAMVIVMALPTTGYSRSQSPPSLERYSRDKKSSKIAGYSISKRGAELRISSKDRKVSQIAGQSRREKLSQLSRYSRKNKSSLVEKVAEELYLREASDADLERFAKVAVHKFYNDHKEPVMELVLMNRPIAKKGYSKQEALEHNSAEITEIISARVLHSSFSHIKDYLGNCLVYCSNEYKLMSAIRRKITAKVRERVKREERSTLIYGSDEYLKTIDFVAGDRVSTYYDKYKKKAMSSKPNKGESMALNSTNLIKNISNDIHKEIMDNIAIIPKMMAATEISNTETIEEYKRILESYEGFLRKRIEFQVELKVKADIEEERRIVAEEKRKLAEEKRIAEEAAKEEKRIAEEAAKEEKRILARQKLNHFLNAMRDFEQSAQSENGAVIGDPQSVGASLASDTTPTGTIKKTGIAN